MRPRLALVYDAMHPWSVGGGERRFHELGTRLAGHGFDVHLYGMKYWDGPDVIERDGLTLHGLCAARPLYTADGRRSISQALVFGLSTLKMVREPFDVIDCCGFPYFSLFACKLAALRRRTPLLATWHEVWGRSYWRTYLGRLGTVGYAVERIAATLPDRVVAVSSTTQTRLRDLLGFRGPIDVVPNGVALAQVSGAAAQQPASDVISAGRLVDFKNVDVILRAVAVLEERGRRVRTVVVGDGPMRASLEALSQELGLQDQVTFAGFLPEVEQVYGLMASSKVYVLASAREGFGISLIEAHAAGLPVVTVDLPDNAATQLVTDAGGSVVALDPTAIADAVEAQLARTEPPEHYRRLADAYDWDALAERLADVYRQSLRPSRTPAIRPTESAR